MDGFVFRNFTIEPLFNKGTLYSGYDEFEEVPSDVKYLVWFYLLHPNVNERIVFDLVNNYLERLNYIISNANDNQTILVFTLSTRLHQFTYENASFEIRNAVCFFNQELLKLSVKYPKVKLIDIDDYFNDFSQKDLIDWKFYYLSKMVLAPNLSNSFQRWFLKKINAIDFKRKKCLILDLDNTLWGGVLGEDGIEGIKLGGDYPGNVYKEFQDLIKNAADAGVILAACSKNNLDDVKELWATHPEIVLKEKDFSAVKINWNDKASNIMEISKELNIGLDSFVFIDDNPRERAQVKLELPEVETPEFPEEPYQLADFFKQIYVDYFQIYKLTGEDLKKTEQYKANAKRYQLKSKVSSMDDYIRNLDIRLSFFINQNIPRVAQMTQKTNQFNLTTIRYSESDITGFVNSGHLIYSLAVDDKFGSNGVTAASIVFINEENHTAEINSFLLSCRILGKNIESVFLNLIINNLFDRGIEKIFAKYIPTKKNRQTQNFFDNNGFLLLKEQNGIKKYIKKIDNNQKIDNKYKIINK